MYLRVVIPRVYLRVVYLGVYLRVLPLRGWYTQRVTPQGVVYPGWWVS